MTYPNDNFNDRNFTTGNTDLPTGEYRYDKDSIHQDAASGQAQQTAASGYHPSDANKKSTGRGKRVRRCCWQAAWCSRWWAAQAAL